jgi:hypothetical protein
MPTHCGPARTQSWDSARIHVLAGSPGQTVKTQSAAIKLLQLEDASRMPCNPMASQQRQQIAR